MPKGSMKERKVEAETLRTEMLKMIEANPEGSTVRQMAEALLPVPKTDVQDRNNQARIQYQARNLEKAKRLRRHGQTWFLAKGRPEPEVADLPAKRPYTRRSPQNGVVTSPSLRAYIIADIRAKLLELEKLG